MDWLSLAWTSDASCVTAAQGHGESRLLSMGSAPLGSLPEFPYSPPRM